jgi:hypothetical protein
VLKSINWNAVRFDVLAVETEASFRPPGFADNVTAYLSQWGYVNVTTQIGRNTCKCVRLTVCMYCII